MALPTTISGAAFPTESSGNLGPFVDGSGNVYFVGSGLAVYKAADPTSSFSEQDATNAPAIGGLHIDAFLDGTTLHIVGINTTGYSTEYAQFDLSTDSWVDASNFGGTSGDTFVEVYNPTDNPTTAWGGIAVRSDGDVVIVHPGENPSIKGGNYQELAYSRLEGGTWTTGVVVASTGGKDDNYLYAYPVMGSIDQCHFGYVRDTDGDFYLRALSSGNTLRTQRTHAGTYSVVGNGINFTRSSTEKIAFNVIDSGFTDASISRVYFNHFTDDTNPTITSETIIGSITLTTSDFPAKIPAAILSVIIKPCAYASGIGDPLTPVPASSKDCCNHSTI